MNTLIGKVQPRDRNDFKVKFTANTKKRQSNGGKELILGSRARTSRTMGDSDNTNKENGFQQYFEEEESYSDETSKHELKIQLSTPKVEYNQINYSVITTEFQVLMSFFDYQVSFKLIYRASNHGFRVKDFHQICDGIEGTLTICLTEDNKIIGGYTPLSWEDHFHKNSTHFKTDFKRQTFIFSVSDKVKYPLVKSLKNKAICCFKAYGPTFGGGYDLLIGDKSNQLPNTTSYFPRNFEHPDLNKFNKRDFTGTSRKNFKVQEWEVFQVIKIHPLHTMENLNFSNAQSEEAGNKKSLFQRFKTAAKDFFNNLMSD